MALTLMMVVAHAQDPDKQPSPSPRSVIPQQETKLLTLKTHCAPNLYHIQIAVHLSPRNSNIKSPKEHGQKLNTDQLWLSAQLREANALFAHLKVCFWIQEVESLSSRDGVMKTRTQRTQLGRTQGRIKRGRIDLFIVNRLNDVDVQGAEIRGVHWRDPQNRDQNRWIILSRIARPKVMAHELGHYFDLPHSRYPGSIMNKKPRKKPPMSSRGFVPQEYTIMKRAWTRMKGSGQLQPTNKPRGVQSTLTK